MVLDLHLQEYHVLCKPVYQLSMYCIRLCASCACTVSEDTSLSNGGQSVLASKVDLKFREWDAATESTSGHLY